MRRRRVNCDVAILGAGAAGLAAAAELSTAGFGVTVLEARDRIGGRVHTLHEPLCPHPVELGAEFIHGRPDEIFQIVRHANLLACDADGEHWRLDKQRLRKLPNAWEEIGAVLEQVGKAFPKGRKNDETFEQFIRRNTARFKRRQREMATLFVEGFNAAPAGRVSARWLADAQRAEEMGGAEEQFRLPGGYDQVLRHLLSRCDPNRCLFRLRRAVTAVDWDERRVVVHTGNSDNNSDQISCLAGLVTLPLGVLQSDAVKFAPPLPAWKREAIAAVEFGSVVKVVVKFNDAFWERQRMPSMARGENLSRMAFLHSRDESFPTWWSWHPLRAATMTGWAGGPAADALAGRPRRQIYAEAVASLGRFFGFKPGDRTLGASVERWWVADWRRDPFARGAYSYVPAGASVAVGRLAAPVEGTLFFAGEATEPAGRSGTVAGAIASGRRAAREVAAALRLR